MRYRALSPTGDYVFGQGTSEFLIDVPDAVAQSVQTRLKLLQGEWFLNLDEGTPYSTDILGENTKPLYDQAIQERILDTDGVTSIQEYASILDQNTRALTVQCKINTVFGSASIRQTL